jgi:hypothetical protein
LSEEVLEKHVPFCALNALVTTANAMTLFANKQNNCRRFELFQKQKLLTHQPRLWPMMQLGPKHHVSMCFKHVETV